MSEIGFSVVVPVYNERDNLHPLVEAVAPVMEKVGGSFELLLVDDGSSDGSSELLDRLADADPRVRVIHFVKNAGQSAAFDAGFQHAQGQVIITLDADLQSDPADIPRLLPMLEEYDAVVGIREQRRDTWWRRFSSRFANGVRNRLTREDIVDTGCPLKVMRAAAIRRVRNWKGSHRFFPTLLRMEGFTVAQVPVSHHPRTAGVSKYGTWDRAFRGLRDALGVRWLQDRHLDWRLR
ncbi:MAG: glycosyltransferase family 2 protein [Acidobacteriota bacterium]